MQTSNRFDLKLSEVISFLFDETSSLVVTTNIRIFAFELVPFSGNGTENI